MSKLLPTTSATLPSVTDQQSRPDNKAKKHHPLRPRPTQKGEWFCGMGDWEAVSASLETNSEGLEAAISDRNAGTEAHSTRNPVEADGEGDISMEEPAGEEQTPLYVQERQYHRILARRVARQQLEERLQTTRKNRKPYLHEGRHGGHARRRPRCPWGRFLTAERVMELKPYLHEIRQRRSRSPERAQEGEGGCGEEINGEEGAGNAGANKRDKGDILNSEMDSVEAGGEDVRPAVDVPQRPLHAKQHDRILKRRAARQRIEEYLRLRALKPQPFDRPRRSGHAIRRHRSPGGHFMPVAQVEEMEQMKGLQDGVGGLNISEAALNDNDDWVIL